jgi:molybdopterin converting factor subunit 1
LFARASDLAGTGSVVLKLPPSTTVGDVRAALLTRFADLELLSHSLLAAVNAEYAVDDQVLTNGCEVAFFPPVSGG